jgi:hypothetical protein
MKKSVTTGAIFIWLITWGILEWHRRNRIVRERFSAGAVADEMLSDLVQSPFEY